MMTIRDFFDRHGIKNAAEVIRLHDCYSMTELWGKNLTPAQRIHIACAPGVMTESQREQIATMVDEASRAQNTRLRVALTALIAEEIVKFDLTF